MVTKTPDVCGGRACVSGTRLAVWFVVEYLQGVTVDQMLIDYPYLTREGLNAACVYYVQHRDEIQADIDDQRRPA